MAVYASVRLKSLTLITLLSKFPLLKLWFASILELPIICMAIIKCIRIATESGLKESITKFSLKIWVFWQNLSSMNLLYTYMTVKNSRVNGYSNGIVEL